MNPIYKPYMPSNFRLELQDRSKYLNPKPRTHKLLRFPRMQVAGSHPAVETHVGGLIFNSCSCMYTEYIAMCMQTSAIQAPEKKAPAIARLPPLDQAGNTQGLELQVFLTSFA